MEGRARSIGEATLLLGPAMRWDGLHLTANAPSAEGTLLEAPPLHTAFRFVGSNPEGEGLTFKLPPG